MNLRESGSGATTAQHMLEALHFLDGTARLVLVDLRTVISGRCKGVAKDMFLLKNPLEQRHPLTMDNVRFLEDLYHSLPNSMKCILGQLLFCVPLMLPMARLTEGQNAVGGTRAW